MRKKKNQRRKSNRKNRSDSEMWQKNQNEGGHLVLGEQTVQFYKVSCLSDRIARKVTTFVIFVEQHLCSRVA